MRLSAILSVTAAASLVAAAAHAAPAAVEVTIAPQLQAKAERALGVRDVSELAARLRSDVEKRVAGNPAFEGARIELTLADAQPNRPTFKQMSDLPSLDFRSHGTGGAAIEGRIVAADGRVTPVSYRYYSTSLRDAVATTTWADADWTFDRFAYELGRGERLAGR